MQEYVHAADDADNNKERCFMELGCLKSLFACVACSSCGASLTVAFGEKMGYSREIRIVCEECTFAQQQYSCTRQDGSTDVTVGFDINSSMVMCFNELGLGEAALRKFSAIMSIPGLAHNTFQRVSKKVGIAHKVVTDNLLDAAVQAVSVSYAQHEDNDNGAGNGDSEQDNSDTDSKENNSDTSDSEENSSDSNSELVDNNDTDSSTTNSEDSEGNDDNGQGGRAFDVTVSFDGTWHKRGFTSNYGVGIVIDVKTGLVLDFEVLSKYCQACALNSKKEMTEMEREEWRRNHAPQCEKNYEGSSKSMEKEAAVRMWRRSVRKNAMRYTRMLSDGDSVAYKAVCDAIQYPVEKLECVNHCDKRMGTALRKKAKENKLGGRRHGALTANVCKILQTYYRTAIIQNLGDATKMREAIWATFYHCSSTDDNPQHQHCPQGPEAWCFYNKAIARGQQPPAHKDNIRTPLSADVCRAIKPIYDRMSDLSLLNKIKHGRTQNANECLNGQIWARCPKTVHVGATRIKAAVASAVSQFNQGCGHLSQVMRQPGATPSSDLQGYQVKQNLKRCAQADVDLEPTTKYSRKAHKRTVKTSTKQQERQEGQTYGPGMM